MVINKIRKALTVTAGAYSANDVVGGRQQLVGIHQGKIQGVVVSDLAAQNVQYNLVFFSSIPTDIADNATFDIADADMSNILGVVPLASAATTRFAFTDNSLNQSYNIGLPVKSDEADGDIWFIMYTTGTPTYAAVTDVSVLITIEQ